MTPTLPDILLGQVAALSASPPPESAGDYMAGRIGVCAMLSLLAAQEAEAGLAVRLWENEAIRSLLADAGATAPSAGEDRRWSGLDAENAALRRALIGLHEAAEAAGDAALDRRILEFYAESARRRALHLPPTP